MSAAQCDVCGNPAVHFPLSPEGVTYLCRQCSACVPGHCPVCDSSEERTYTVVFHYTVTVDAPDSDTAEDIAAELLQGQLDEVEFRRYFVQECAASVDHAGALH